MVGSKNRLQVSMAALNLNSKLSLKMQKCFSCYCFWFVKSIVISEFVAVFNAKGKRFQIHVKVDALKIQVIFFCT